jgi:hypothetical protein
VPQWIRLREISGEVNRLITRGEWTEAEYIRMRARAIKVVPGFPRALEFLANKADPAWLK